MKISEIQKLLKEYEDKYGDMEISTCFNEGFGYRIEKEDFSVIEFLQKEGYEITPPCVYLQVN